MYRLVLIPFLPATSNVSRQLFPAFFRSCRSQLAHHNKSRKHRRRCTPGSFYSTKRTKPHAAQAARAKARLLAAQQAAAAAAAAGGDTAAQQAAAAAAVAAAAAAAMAEAKSKKAAAQAASKRASASVAAAAAAAAAHRAVKTEAPTSSQAAAGAAASLVTRRAAAAAAAAMDEDLAAAAEAAASAAAAQHQRGMAAAMGGYGMTADIWGRLDHTDVVSGAAGSGGTFHRFAPAAVSGHQSAGLDYTSGGYSMAQMQQMQQQQMQMQGLGSMGGTGMMLNPRVPGNSMAGVCGPYTQAAGSGGAAGPLCGSGLLHGRATVSAGSGRMTQQQGEEDAGSSSCCSSRGSPMLSGARRQQRNLLLSASSAPTGSLAQYMHPGGLTGAAPLGSMSTMPPLPPTVYTTHQHQQQLLAANAAAAAGAAGPSGTVRSNSASAAYAAARAAAMAAATARSNGARGWRGLLPAEQAQMLLQAGGSSYDSCPDIWSGQPGSLENSLAQPGSNAAAAGSSPAGVYLMHKVGRSRMDQNPGSSARQAAAMAGYQALQQQQQQELEQLQLWHRIQTSRQVVTALGRGTADLAPMMTSADLAAAAATQGTSSQPMYPPCAGEVNSGMNAAMAAGMHASMGPAGAGRLPPVRVVSTATGGSMPGQVDFYQGQHPAGVSLPSADARLDSQPGAKAARDAVAGDLLAMVNPTDLLGDAQGPFDLGWHPMHPEGQMPAQTPPGASMQGHGQHQGHTHHGHFAHSGGLKAVVGARAGGPSSATAAAAAVAAAGVAPGVGLDAGDIADLWDVLEEYEGGDKESCDALFEHLTDLF